MCGTINPRFDRGSGRGRGLQSGLTALVWGAASLVWGGMALTWSG